MRLQKLYFFYQTTRQYNENRYRHFRALPDLLFFSGEYLSK